MGAIGLEALLPRSHKIAGLPQQGCPPLDMGSWDPEVARALVQPVLLFAKDQPPGSVRYHHTGFTYPDRRSFDAATTNPDLIANQLVTPVAVHHRRYLPVPAQDGGLPSYVEHHIVGAEGDGVRGFHFDFATPDPEGLLALVEDTIGRDDALRGSLRVVKKAFGGGNAPVAKVGIQPVGDPTSEISVMTRTHWSDPTNW